MPVVSVKVDEQSKQLMEKHEEINWSAVMRRSIAEKIRDLEATRLDKKRALRAIQDAVRIQEKHVLKKGEKTGAELIREWRDKRR
ncbi:MAG TPA: hypothetical protein VJA40_05340 [archaeon]|nr:hypothetical protein [archaeon]